MYCNLIALQSNVYHVRARRCQIYVFMEILQNLATPRGLLEMTSQSRYLNSNFTLKLDGIVITLIYKVICSMSTDDVAKFTFP